MVHQNDLITDKNVVEFLTVAQNYCDFIDNEDQNDKNQVLSYLNKLLPLLYLKGTLLQNVDISDEDAYERFVTEEQWQNIYNRYKNIMGIDDIYKSCHNLDAIDNEPYAGSISEDLADIYQDMKDFVLLYNKNTLAAKENAIFWCKFHFEINWGYKLLNTSKIIHTILHKSILSENISYE